VLKSHLITLILFSGLVSVFFAALTRETPKDAVKIGSIMLGSMVGMSILVAWLMYFFPLG